MKGTQFRSALIAAFCIFALVESRTEEQKTRHLRYGQRKRYQPNKAILGRRDLEEDGSSSSTTSTSVTEEASTTSTKSSKSSKSTGSSTSGETDNSTSGGKGSSSKSKSKSYSESGSTSSTESEESSSQTNAVDSVEEASKKPTASPVVSPTTSPVAALKRAGPTPSPTRISSGSEGSSSTSKSNKSGSKSEGSYSPSKSEKSSSTKSSKSRSSGSGSGSDFSRLVSSSPSPTAGVAGLTENSHSPVPTARSSGSDEGNSSTSKSGKSSSGSGGSASTSKSKSSSTESQKSSSSETSSPTASPIVDVKVVTPEGQCLQMSEEDRINGIQTIVSSMADDAMLQDTNSSHSKASQWLVNADPSFVCPLFSAKVVQRYALAVFYYSTGGDDWAFCSANDSSPCPSDEERFLSSSSECNWVGVSCNEYDKVNALKMERLNGQDIGLKGTIPPEIFSILRLKALELEFHTADKTQRGQLEGPIPEALLDAKKIKALDLQRQKISGEIPAALYASSLKEVELDSNQLTGSISSLIGNMTNLVFFTASNNPFDKQLLTSGFGEISGLKFLGLNKANLIGPVPESFKNLTSIQSIDLSDNEMTGDISFLEDYEDLRTVALDNNTFSGQIPDELWNKTNMTIINLENNRFNGTIPDSIGQMTMLKTLRLAYNNLTGPIPASLKNLTNLRVLTISGNNFDDGSSIPVELCDQGTLITIPTAGVECPGDCCYMQGLKSVSTTS